MFGAQSAKVVDQDQGDSAKQDSDSEVPITSKAVFTFQTFVPDKYLPGASVLAYGDNRGFGEPGDSYRTFQQIVVQPDERLNEAGAEGPAEAKTGVSETILPAASGHASAAPLHMAVERRDAHSVTVGFDASIQHGAWFGELFPAIDFTGAVTISNSAGKQAYGFYVSHDAFPAYEAFINGSPIYRWSYPAGSTVADLVGSGTAIQGKRKTGDSAGGTIGGGTFKGFGGGSGGGGGAGGGW